MFMTDIHISLCKLHRFSFLMRSMNAEQIAFLSYFMLLNSLQTIPHSYRNSIFFVNLAKNYAIISKTFSFLITFCIAFRC